MARRRFPDKWEKNHRMEVRQIMLTLESLGLAQAGLIGQGRQRGPKKKPELEEKNRNLVKGMSHRERIPS